MANKSGNGDSDTKSPNHSTSSQGASKHFIVRPNGSVDKGALVSLYQKLSGSAGSYGGGPVNWIRNNSGTAVGICLTSFRGGEGLINSIAGRIRELKDSISIEEIPSDPMEIYSVLGRAREEVAGSDRNVKELRRRLQETEQFYNRRITALESGEEIKQQAAKFNAQISNLEGRLKGTSTSLADAEELTNEALRENDALRRAAYGLIVAAATVQGIEVPGEEILVDGDALAEGVRHFGEFADKSGAVGNKLEEVESRMGQLSDKLQSYQRVLAELEVICAKVSGEPELVDLETEFTSVMLTYLTGKWSGQKVNLISKAFVEHKIPASRHVAVPEIRDGKPEEFNISVRKLGDFYPQLENILGCLSDDTSDTKTMRQRVVRYAALALGDEVTPALWTDDREVSLLNLAIAYRGTVKNVQRRIIDTGQGKINAIKIEQGGDGLMEVYRWGDVKEFFPSDFSWIDLRRPQPVSEMESLLRKMASVVAQYGQFEEMNRKLDEEKGELSARIERQAIQLSGKEEAIRRLNEQVYQFQERTGKGDRKSALDPDAAGEARRLSDALTSVNQELASLKISSRRTERELKAALEKSVPAEDYKKLEAENLKLSASGTELTGLKQIIGTDNVRDLLSGSSTLRERIDRLVNEAGESGQRVSELSGLVDQYKTVVDSTEELCARLLETVLPAEAGSPLPDSEAEVEDPQIAYLLGMWGKDDTRKVTQLLEQSQVPRARIWVGGVIIRRVGDIVDNLDRIFGSLPEFVGDDESKTMRSRLMAYFSGTSHPDWDYNSWEEGKKVTRRDLALALGRTTSGVGMFLKKAEIEPTDDKVQVDEHGYAEVYVWNSQFKEAVRDRKSLALRRPQIKLEQPTLEEKLQRVSASYQELQRNVEQLQKKLADVEKGLNLTTEEKLVQAFKAVYAPEMASAIKIYDEKYNDGFPEGLDIALTPLLDYVLGQLGGRLIEIDSRFSEEVRSAEEIKQILREQLVHFNDTDYAREYGDQFAIAQALYEAKNLNVKHSERMNDAEQKAKALVDNYRAVSSDHERKKEEAGKLLEDIEHLKTVHAQASAQTEQFRATSLPFQARLGCHAYSLERDGKYVVRFVLPVSQESYAENAALQFTLALASTFRGRKAEVNTGKVAGCNFIELTYDSAVRGRVDRIISSVQEQLSQSLLAKMGATIELKYWGEIK